MDVVVKNISTSIQRITIVPPIGVPYDRAAAPGRYVVLTDEEYALVEPLDPRIWELAAGEIDPPLPDPDEPAYGPTGPTGPTGPAGPVGSAGTTASLIATTNWRFTGIQLTWDDPMYVSYPGLTDGRNTIQPGSTTLNNNDILYVHANLTSGVDEILVPQVNPIDTVASVPELFIIARRYGNIYIQTQLPTGIYEIQP